MTDADQGYLAALAARRIQSMTRDVNEVSISMDMLTQDIRSGVEATQHKLEETMRKLSR